MESRRRPHRERRTSLPRARIRRTVLALACLLSAIVLLHLANYLRFDLRGFTASAETLIQRSRHLRAAARPSYQDEVLAAMPANAHNGPFLRLDAALSSAVTLQEDRKTDPGAALAGDRPATDLLVFEFDDESAPGLVSASGRSTLRVRNGTLRVDYAGPDFLVNVEPLALPREKIGEIVIRARADRGTLLRLGWNKAYFKESNSLDVQLVADGEFHTYVIDARNALESGLQEGEKLEQIYLRPSNARAATVDIDYVRWTTRGARYRQRPRGFTYESLGKELRAALYVVPPQTLEYRLEVPEFSAVLDFGIGTLHDGPVTFEVLVAAAGPPEEIFAARVASSAEWQDARLDLSRWAGREVELSLRVTADGDNVGFWSNPIVSSAPEMPFNVIMILEDTLRADHLSTYGHELPTSPFKDRLLADGGVVFANALSQATKTRPSVPSLMTSLLPTATGVWGFSDALDDRYLTLAEILRAQGFRTAAFVQNPNAGPAAGLHQGFGTVLTATVLGSETEGIAGDRVRAWIERHRDRNFFAYLHCMDPHGVYDPPPPFDRWYREAPGGGTPVTPSHRWHDAEWVEEPTLEGRRLLYDGEIRHNDAVVEELVSWLQELGIFERTLIVFLSDHGEYLGEHDRWGHRPPGLLQVLDVPLMLVYPDRYRESRNIEETVQLLDVAPTILELAGVERRDLLLQGDSLIDLVEGRRLEYWRNRITVSEEPFAMLRGAPARNLAEHVTGSLFFQGRHFISSRAFGPDFLPAVLRLRTFDLTAEREEAPMLFSALPDLYLKYRFMRTLSLVQGENMAAWKSWTRDSRASEHAVDPAAVEQLKALGYID